MAQIDIGLGKTAKRGYHLDEISIVPSRRTRDRNDVDLGWEIDAFRFSMPVMGSAMDSVSSPETVIALGKLGGLGVLALDGLWTRYENPQPLLAEIASLKSHEVSKRLSEMYSEPIKADLIKERVHQIKEAGVVAAGSLSPQNCLAHLQDVLASELDMLVIQGTLVTAEHKSTTREPLNLKRVIREITTPVIVGGCASYEAALHLMRTGAAAVLVGVGSSRSSTLNTALGVGVPLATAIADVRAARIRHLDETGVYCQVIADGGLRTGGDIAKAIVCGADAVMIGSPLAASEGAPGGGYHWGHASAHPSLPRGRRVKVKTTAPLQEVLLGPTTHSHGRTNLMGALATSMANTGHTNLKELQKAELVISPSA